MMGDRRDSARAVSAAYRSLVGEDLSKLDVAREKKQREWIWEYLLKFCPDQSIIRELLKVFPFPDDSLVLKRMFLLKTLTFQAAEPLLPDRTLDVLRALADLGIGQPPGNDLLFAVMVELTVQHLRDVSLDIQRFSEALEKHWGPSVDDTEDRYQDDHGTLETTRQELRAVLERDSCRAAIVRRHPRGAVERMLKAYLDQSWEEIGPTFLEIAEKEQSGVSAQGNDTAGVPVNDVIAEGANVGEEDHSNEQRVTMAGAVSPNIEIGVDADPSGVVQAIRDLRETEKHLYKAVKDPLPDALLRAGQVQEMVQAERHGEPGGEAAHANVADAEMDIGNKAQSPQPNVREPPDSRLSNFWSIQSLLLLFDWTVIHFVHDNPSSCQFFKCVEEDISSPEEGVAKPSKRVMLRRPTERHYSPLSPFDSPPQVKVRRRMRHMWTEIEELTLKKEVEK